MRIALFCATFLALPLWSQSASKIEDSFFQQDPKTVMTLCIDKVRALHSKNPRLLAEWGRIHLALGERKQAEEDFQQAVKLGPKDSETHRLIALAWLHQGEKGLALEAHKAMLAANPKDDDTFADAAMDLLDAGHITEARAMMESTWVSNRKNESKFREFALAWVALNQPEDAATWMERARASDPKDWDKDWGKNLAFGRAAYQHRMDALAAKWMARAIAADPREEHVWNDIATLFAERLESSKSPKIPQP